jgi:hypothetical protein
VLDRRTRRRAPEREQTAGAPAPPGQPEAPTAQHAGAPPRAPELVPGDPLRDG